jgi:hypothetical protein
LDSRTGDLHPISSRLCRAFTSSGSGLRYARRCALRTL